MELARDLKAAFGSTWSSLGILFSGLSIFNYLVRTINFGISVLIGELLKAFRSTFHPIVEFFLGWVPLHWTDPMKDAVVVWLALSGVCVRAMWAQGKVDSSGSQGLGIADFVRFTLVSVLFLPLMILAFLVSKRRVYKKPNGGWQWTYNSPGVIRDGTVEYVYSTRTVFVLQLAAVAGVVVGLTVLNAASI